MADEKAVQKPKSLDIAQIKQSINNKFENENPSVLKNSKATQKQSSIPGDDKKQLNTEDVFKKRAISFLKSINTGSPPLQGKTSPVIEPLHLVRSDTNPNPGFIRNQEEDNEINKVQA